MNFGFWGSEPQTLNLRYRWYGGICRGCEMDRAVKEFSAYPSPFRRYSTSNFDLLTSFAYKPEVGGAK